MPRIAFSRLATREPVAGIGDTVQTVSGVWLGLVAERAEEAFLVRGKSLEFWLSDSSVFTRAGGYLTLICEREGLMNYASSRAPVVQAPG
jgi:hypothetical protein